MGELVVFPGTADMNKPVTHQRIQGIANLLAEELEEANNGRLRAVAIVSVYADEDEATLQWMPNPIPSKDYQKMVTGLTVILHQLAALVPHATENEEIA